jgi:hypothetical protein
MDVTATDAEEEDVGGVGRQGGGSLQIAEEARSI